MRIHLLLILLLLAFGATRGVAQYSLGPVVIDHTVRAGTETQITFVLDSRGADSVTCKAGLSDFRITLQGKPQPASSPLPRGCSGWLTLTTPSVVLEPGASKGLVCKVRVPRDANGSYSALLAVDIVPGAQPAGAETGGSVRFTLRKSAVLLLNVVGSGRAASNVAIASLELQLATDNPGPSSADSARSLWNVRCTVGNSGNLHARVDGDVSVRDEGASRVVRRAFVTGRGYVLAGADRSFEASGRERLPDGVYAVTASFRPRGARVAAISASQTFVVSAGKVSRGEPSEALRREIEAARPWFLAAPENLYYEVTPRGRRMKQAQIFNLTNQTLNLVPHIVAWEHDGAGEITFPEAPRHQRFLSDAVTVTPATLSIRPRGQQNVTLTYAVPAGATGEYYAAVVFAPEGQQLSTDRDVLAQRAILLSAAVPGTLAADATVSQLDLKMLESGAYEFHCSVANTGNARCGVHGKIRVSTEGKAVDELEFGDDDVALLPGESRSFTVAWPRVLESGKYQVVASVEYIDKKTAARTLGFEIK